MAVRNGRHLLVGATKDYAARRNAWQRWLADLAGMLDVAPDVARRSPRAVWDGEKKLHIENHRGVAEYNPRRVRVRTTVGDITISGRRLMISNIFQQELTVVGHIEAINMPELGNV